jgi:hypothetical protein
LATSWCATIVGVLQLLLAGLHCWILLDLHYSGARMTPLVITFATAFLVVQLVILCLALNLPHGGMGKLRVLAALYVLGLAVFVAILLAELHLKSWMLQPDAVLPPNEIMGRDWPLGVAMMAFGLAQLLGILPLTLVAVTLMRLPSLFAPAK